MFKIRLKALRESKGMTQRDFAADFGISKGTVGMWESGAREPKTIDELNRIADYFEVSSDYLLGRTNEKEKPTPVSEDGLDPELEALIKRIPADRMPEVERYLRFQAEQGEKP